jgi:hypothetical protein
MIYVKSILAGMAAFILCAILAVVLSSILLNWDAPSGTAIGIDPISILRSSWGYQLLALLVFGVGFYWEFLRASK